MGQSRLAVLHKEPLKLVYVAGRVTGMKNLNREAFAAASQKLREQGWHVFNPSAAGMYDGRPLREIMAYLLPRVCECQAIAMQRGWWRSGGARVEWLLAKYLGLRIIYL